MMSQPSADVVWPGWPRPFTRVVKSARISGSLGVLAVADWQLSTGHREHNAFPTHSMKALAATRLTHPRLRIPLGWPSHERALAMVDTSATVMAILALPSAAACEVMGAELLLDGAANWLPLAWAAANPGFTDLHHASFSAFPLIWTPNASRNHPRRWQPAVKPGACWHASFGPSTT